MKDADAEAEAEGEGLRVVEAESTKEAEAAAREGEFAPKSVLSVSVDLLRATLLDDEAFPRRNMFFQVGEVGEGTG